MTETYLVRRLDGAGTARCGGELADVLLDCVDGGASVSFMAPMTRERALAYWREVAASVGRGERTVLVAADGEGIVGTVQLITGLPENQPHRADVAKLLVHRRGRGAGIGERLMRAVEESARQQGRRVLVLDTANPAAERLYMRLEWQRVGAVPDYALLPDGALCDTTFFYKHV
jgi:ribosomal protein S18 acetylase RimI-like enzyme